MTIQPITRLSSSIRILPRVNDWCANPYLLSPVTFGLYTQHAHLSVLDSFISDPEQHRIASRRQELRGGPFLDYDGEVKDIRVFRDQTRDRCAVQLRYAAAINALYALLREQATGTGLQGLYAKIDPLIRDKVEIFYDVCKQPGVRFLERLFFDSSAYDATLQSCMLERVTDEVRPFSLSTPQIRRTPGSLDVRAPFSDPLWDKLCGGTRDADELIDLLLTHVTPAERNVDQVRQMLCTDALPEQAPGNGVRVRYFGHACVLIQGAGISILIDPLIGYPGESSIEHYTFDDLPAHIDYVLLTHAHHDHVVMETLLRIRHRIGKVIVGRSGGGGLQDLSLKLILQRCGFPVVAELGEYEEVAFPGGRIVAAPFYGEHSDLDVRCKVVHAVEIEGKVCVLFSDSRPPAAEFYEPLRRMFPKIHCVFLGMECVGAPATWLYGSLLQETLTRREDQTRRLDGCDFERALELLKFFQPERLYVYAMGAEPWISHITSIFYSEDLEQFKAARQLEAAAKESGRHAQLLFGTCQVTL